MIREVVDPHSGAILFKEDEDTLTMRKLQEQINELRIENIELKNRIKRLEDSK